MPKFKIKGKFPKFNKRKFTRDVEKSLKKEFKRGLIAWMKSMQSTIPVYTGKAISTVIHASGPEGPLHKYLGTASTIRPSFQARLKSKDRNLSAGELRAFGAAHGSYELSINVKKGILFKYSSSLNYFDFNEFNDARAVGFNLRHPTPWHSLDKAELAFLKAMKDIRITPYIFIDKYFK